MPTGFNRRAFLQWTTGLGVAAYGARASAWQRARASGANERLVVAVMGVNGRGQSLARGFAGREGVEVGYICDVDSQALNRAMLAMEDAQARQPAGVADVRRVLDDPAVDILIVAAPNHWHAPATIMACQAGKHVYVEKPCSHTAREGEWAIAAARKWNRVVTMGTQRRSRASIIEAIEKVRGGEIGEVRYARTWYGNRRPSIGRGRVTEVPEGLNFDLWQGPVPRRPFKDNVVHYNWHWLWHWGNGELGNNGVHALDLARWGLGVDYPTGVTAGGGRYRWEDDQETPDTMMVSLEFGDRLITWEGLSWSPMGPGGSMFGVTFHGDQGTLELLDSGHRIFDMRNKEIGSFPGTGGDVEHFDDFLRCIRQGGHPTADIEEGHKSTLLCHLGNIAYRVGHKLQTRPDDGHILDDPAAEAHWSKEYEPGWKPQL
jgi:predicted dehydrogenase